MRFSICFVLASLLTCAGAFAQDPSVNTANAVGGETSATAALTLDQALKCPPPERAQCGRNLAQNDSSLGELDAWISNAPNDADKSLVIKDMLEAMPPAVAGPRMTELARKCTIPDIQPQYARYLKKYPDAYASVLVSWLKNSAQNHAHFNTLLDDYYGLRESDAMQLWARLVANNPASELGQVASFGLDKKTCGSAIAKQIGENTDETPRLRLLNRFAQCKSGISADNPDLAHLTDAISSLLSHQTISRRISAIRAIGALPADTAKSAQFADRLDDIYKNAKNSTERAYALQTLDILDAPAQNNRLADALQNGDEVLRLQAATLIANNHAENFDLNIIGMAFDKEIWPDTLEMLYKAITASGSMGEKNEFRRQILRDPKKPVSLRLIALSDLTKDSPQNVTATDMAEIQAQQDVPDDLIASVAEAVYAAHPADRPVLRQWLEAQQPFDRRYITTFARFLSTDTRDSDSAAIQFVHTMCSHAVEQTAILQPCISYLEKNAVSGEDKSLLESLKSKSTQNNTISEFAF